METKGFFQFEIIIIVFPASLYRRSEGGIGSAHVVSRRSGFLHRAAVGPLWAGQPKINAPPPQSRACSAAARLFFLGISASYSTENVLASTRQSRLSIFLRSVRYSRRCIDKWCKKLSLIAWVRILYNCIQIHVHPLWLFWLCCAVSLQQGSHVPVAAAT